MNVRTKRMSKNIVDALLPMTIGNWIIGCGGVIEYPLGNPKKIFSFIYSTICALTYFLVLYLSAYYDQKILLKNFGTHYRHVGNVFFEVIFLTNIFIVFAMIIMGWTRRHELKLVMEKIERADKLLQKLGISVNYEEIHKRQLCLVISVTLMSTIIITANWVNASIFTCPTCDLFSKILISMRRHYPMVLLIFNDFKFIGLIWCLERKFEKLNDFLEKMSVSSPFFPQYLKLIYFKTGINKASPAMLGQKTNDDTNIMRTSKEVHLDLVQICRLCNNIFGFHLLISLTLFVTFIIVLCYNFYIDNIYSKEDPQYDKIITACFYFFIYLIKICVVNNICDKTSYEALRTGSIINELHEPETNKEFRTEIREFTLQLMQNPLIFTAYGFFKLDNNFIRNVGGSVTTYLIILIQLRDLTTD